MNNRVPSARLRRDVTLALTCLSVALVILPLTHHKPGMPATLKADEPAYYLAALSLVKDGDLRCEPRDLARLYQEYPYTPVRNLILSTDDGWHTVYFGKPYIFSFLAAPFAGIWGANGLVLFNTLLLVAMIWMTSLYLARYNADWLAALFTAGFFLMSTTYTYVYWLQPELLNMFAVAACLFFGLHVADPERHGEVPPEAGKWGVPPEAGKRNIVWARLVTRQSAERLALLVSASALILGVYNKPMLAAMGLPVCFRLLRQRRWQDLAVWLAGAALALGLVAGISIALTGHPTAYLGVDRQGYSVHTPHVMPMQPDAPVSPPAAARPEATLPAPEEPPHSGAEARPDEVRPPADTPAPRSEAASPKADQEAAEPELGKETAGWWWIFQVPVISFAEFREDLVYFFIGRHTGLFLYQPFALISLILFFAFARRSPVRWTVLASLVVVALFFLTFLSHNWHGGGGFVGNRYFLTVYPAFAYLVRRIRPDWLVALGFAAGGLFIGPLLLSPFGLLVPSPTLQAHARNHPFQAFPFEHSLRELPGYWGVSRAGVFVHGRKDHLRPEGEQLWIAGGDSELWLSSLEPLDELVFEVESPTPDNQVVIEIEDARERLTAGPEAQRVVLSPSRPTLMRKDRNRADWQTLLEVYVYRLKIRTASGEMPSWRHQGKQFFYRGCVLTFLGTGNQPAFVPESSD